MKAQLERVGVTVEGLDRVRTVPTTKCIAEYVALHVLRRMSLDNNLAGVRQARQWLRAINPESTALPPTNKPEQPFPIKAPNRYALPPLEWKELEKDANGVMFPSEAYVLGPFAVPDDKAPDRAKVRDDTYEQVKKIWLLPGNLSKRVSRGGAAHSFNLINLKKDDNQWALLPAAGQRKFAFYVMYLASPKRSDVTISVRGHAPVIWINGVQTQPGRALQIAPGKAYVLVFATESYWGRLRFSGDKDTELWQGGGATGIQAPKR